MHIILQKPGHNASIESIAHWHSHISNWIESGKQVNAQGNGTMAGIASSMASSNASQLTAGLNTVTPNQ